MPSCASATQSSPQDEEIIEVQIYRIRQICDLVADRSIRPCTFSRWCGRLELRNDVNAYVPLNKAAALVTFAGLQKLGVKAYDGLAYQHYYPTAYRKLKDQLDQEVPLYA